MSGWDAFWVGIAPEHRPALVAAILVFVGLGVLRRTRGAPRPIPLADRWAARLLAVSAAVHLALPLGHNENGLLTAGFLASGVAYAWVALRVLDRRPWRAYAALLVVATLVAYLFVVLRGGEEPDQVGLATALVELTAFGLAIKPAGGRLLRRTTAGTATVTALLVVGVATWLGAFAAHDAADADVTTVQAADGHAHGHAHAARAQAGVVMRPLQDHHPTAEQLAAADRLAAETVAATGRYADILVAEAAGYAPQQKEVGLEVHLKSDSYSKDGRALDPQRPEQLVYAVESGGRATLLGVVYVMERAGVPGPAPGGPITGWHAHDGCVTVLPPGFGVTSPYGGCPALSIQATVPEMMHVWTVDNPRGPYAESLDPAWVRAYLAKHGQ